MSKMTRYRRAVAKTGSYVHRESGQTKAQYANIGTLFRGENDDGTPYMSLKLDSVPVGQGWDGWVSFYEFDESRGKPKASSKAPRAAEEGFDDDIPF